MVAFMWLIELMLPIAVWIVKKFIGALDADHEARKAFLAFLEIMEDAGLMSVKLHDQDRAQLEDLRARRKKLQAEATQ